MFTYIMSIMMSLMLFSMFFVMMTLSVASAQRIAEVLQEVPDLKNPQNAETVVKDGSIRFSHVSFSYKHGSGEETLHNIDFSVSSGETIGIIGGTGSGKSSLMRRVGRHAQAAGLETEEVLCSGDPGSLDALLLPQLGAAIVDGTAPQGAVPLVHEGSVD